MSELNNLTEEKKNEPTMVEDNWEEQVRGAGITDTNEKGDIIADAILFAFGVYVFIVSIKMPTQILSGGLWYVAPGVFPALMGALLCILTAFQALSAYRKLRKKKAAGAVSKNEKKSKEYVINFLVIAILLCSYIFLLGVVPYRIITFVFLAASMLFYDTKHTWKHILIDLVVSGATTLIVAFAFESLAKIPLP